MGEEHIVFVYANDLWIVGHDGGDAERLPSFPGTETQLHISPNGERVAFTGQYDGDTDAFDVPIEGEIPVESRLTRVATRFGGGRPTAASYSGRSAAARRAERHASPQNGRR